ncbi:MAG: hypothetical protein ACFFBE_08260, partial [Promethearchaeota archaeon]
MDEDLKNLIDTVELEAKTRAQLEAQIKSMKEEINRLKFTIKEQHLLIEEQGDQISFAQSDLPSEINILKDMITSQRKDLVKRDENIERLNQKIDELTIQIEKSKDGVFVFQDDDIYEAQELILKLSQESEDYRNEIENLQNQISTLEDERNNLMETSQAQTEENVELINIKRLNFQLMEQNGLLRVEIESLKAKLNEKIQETSSEQLESANEKIKELTSEIESLKTQIQEQNREETSAELELAQKRIEDLVSEIEDYDAQLTFLQKELEKSNEVPIIPTEEALKFAELREEYDQLKSELLRIQQENEELNKLMLDSNAQLDVLQEELKKSIEVPIIPTEEALKFAELREEYDQLKSELLRIQQENEELNKLMLDSNAQLEVLQEELKKSNEVPIISNEGALRFAELREEYDQLKSELLRIQQENEELNKL